MNISAIHNLDVANGPGIRVSVFVSGCTRKCPGCFNQVAWDFDYGTVYDSVVEHNIIELLGNPHIAGLSILGGEPLESRNQSAVARLIRAARDAYPDKTIWLFSGYTIEELYLNNPPDADLMSILKNIDVLVDGPFLQDRRNLALQFRGSSNQRLIDVPRTIQAHQIILWSSE